MSKQRWMSLHFKNRRGNEDGKIDVYLHEGPLHPGHVGPVVEEPPHVVTEPVPLPQALRQTVHPLGQQGGLFFSFSFFFCD